MVFLRAPRTLSSAVTTLPDPFPALVELQRAQARPIALVPLTFLWRKRPKKLGGSWRDALLGDPTSRERSARSSVPVQPQEQLPEGGETVSLADVNAMTRARSRPGLPAVCAAGCTSTSRARPGW